MDKIYKVSAFNGYRPYDLGFCATLDLAMELAKRASTYGEFEEVKWEWVEGRATADIRGETFEIDIISLINSSEKILEIV